MLSGIKVVFLDIDNTLLDFNACSRLSMEKSFKECGLTFENRVYDAFHRINDGLWRRIEQGTYTRAELHRERWALVLEALDMKGDGSEIEERFLEHLAQDAVPMNGAYELLEYLYPRYTVCIASNAPYEQQLKRLTKVDMLRFFHKQFISEKMGAAKPSKAFFDACFAQLPNVKPQECIIIGDSVTADICGGKEYGLYSCWYDHKHTNTVCEEADFTISSLKELTNIL